MMVLWMHSRLLGFLVLVTGIYNVKAWTYHYKTDINMDWTTARQWCQKNYTDMVAIQNQEEVEYLNQVLPFSQAYYWIGIRKIDGYWTWVGTNKRLDSEAANWAKDEPNNKGSGQDCVEIYIKRSRETAKWNDERCSKKKATVCYLASCSKKSCSEHAECVETIGNYRCQCHPGFKGPRCEEVVQCWPIGNPQQGFVKCDGVFGGFHFNSSCQFQCATGFKLEGAQRLHCLASGHWDNALPVCQAVQCLPIIDTPGGWRMNCTHPLSINSYDSSCDFECEDGFELKGSKTTLCDQTGQWTHKPPTCTVVTCNAILAPANGHLTCADPLGKFSFNSSCNVSCDEGYKLRGKATLTCLSAGNWSAPTPVCEVVKCDPLRPIPHGFLQCHDPVEEFAYGSTCWLKCDTGFVHTGKNFTHCTKQGNWSHIPPVCQAQQCSPLTDPSHGTLTCTHPNGQFSFGTVCEVSCQMGFKLHGTHRIECLEMGKWTDTPPFCLAQQCPHLTAPQNGWVNCSHPHSLFSYGSQCFLGCETGFEIRGEPGMECSASGNWSQEMSSCAAVRCEPLSLSHPPELGLSPSMNCSHPHGNFSFGSQCIFRCAESHKLNGTSQLICTSSGYWTNSPPSCAVKEMSVIAGLQTYAAVGAASGAGLLLLGGLMFLLMRQFTKKAHYGLNDSLWAENLNPTFEFN